MKRLLWLVVVAVAGWPALADAETLYVRSSGGVYGTEDGSSYANAFDGFGDISWGGGAGQVGPGDTLYVCGAHTAMLTVGVVGESGSNIVLDGACPDDAGTVNVGATATMAIEQRSVPEGRDYITVQNLTLIGGTTATIHCNGSGSSDCRGNVYQDNAITASVSGSSVGGIAVRNPRDTIIRRNDLNGAGLGGRGILLDDPVGNAYPLNANNLVDDNDIYGWTWFGIRFAGFSDAVFLQYPGTISNNRVHDNGDGIYHYRTTGVVTEYNTVYQNNLTSTFGEGYGLASTLSANGTWRGNISHTNRTKGLEPWYSDASTASEYTDILFNTFYGNGTGGEDFHCAIHMNNNGSNVNFPNTVIAGNVVIGSQCGINVYRGTTGTVTNNTIINPTAKSGIFIGSDAANLTIINNIISTGAIPGVWTSDSGIGSGVVFSHNLYDAAITGTAFRTASTNYALAQVTTPEPTALTESLAFLGPSARDYRLRAESSNRRGGTATTSCIDKRARVCWLPPDIGAYQSTSGDPANAHAPITQPRAPRTP